MADCTVCGRGLSEVARFCPDCGTPVAHRGRTTPGRAPDGGAEPPGRQPLHPPPRRNPSRSAAPPETPAEPPGERPTSPSPAVGRRAPSAEASQAPAGRRRRRAGRATRSAGRPETCASCGAVLPADDLFCGDCGAPCGGAAAPPCPPAPVSHGAGPRSTSRPHTGRLPAAPGVADYLSFKALW